MRILTDLRDIHGRLVAGAGTNVTPGVIRDVCRRGRPFQKRLTGLNKSFIRNDLKKIMNEEIHARIFQPPEIQEKILEVVKKTKLQTALYREIVPLRESSHYNYRHFLLIGAISCRMALDLRKAGYDPRAAFFFGLVHDIGKTRVPHAILNKTTPLTETEFRILKNHPIKSFILLSYYLGPRGKEACRVGCDHHERLDGSGYPKGIRTVSKYTKLVAVADIFDALVAHRPYRKNPFTVRGAIDKLIGEMYAGKHPRLPILLLIRYFRARKESIRKMKISLRPREAEPTGSLYGMIAA